ncbi:MAG: hypothetical protein HXY44_09850 [Syntrophaceae bacterium]|nr:hypothetical protein [Syntrophaceae bacterium]
MAVKAIEMVRKIRDKHYEETKNLSAEEQIKFIKICQNTPQLCWGDEWPPSPLGGEG